MPKGKKRKPDLRKIRTTKTYRLQDIALALDRHINTVRSWANEGLPSLDKNKPPIFLGADVKKWLKSKWTARKQTCKIDELFCMKCKAPRQPKPNSISFKSRNEKSVRIIAICSHCSTNINQIASKAKLTEIKAAYHALQPHKQHLSGYGNTSSKPEQKQTSLSPSENPMPKAQFTLDFGELPVNGNAQKQAKERADAKTKSNQ